MAHCDETRNDTVIGNLRACMAEDTSRRGRPKYWPRRVFLLLSLMLLSPKLPAGLKPITQCTRIMKRIGANIKKRCWRANGIVGACRQWNMRLRANENFISSTSRRIKMSFHAGYRNISSADASKEGRITIERSWRGWYSKKTAKPLMIPN